MNRTGARKAHPRLVHPSLPTPIAPSVHNETAKHHTEAAKKKSTIRVRALVHCVYDDNNNNALRYRTARSLVVVEEKRSSSLPLTELRR